MAQNIEYYFPTYSAPKVGYLWLGSIFIDNIFDIYEIFWYKFKRNVRPTLHLQNLRRTNLKTSILLWGKSRDARSSINSQRQGSFLFQIVLVYLPDCHLHMVNRSNPKKSLRKYHVSHHDRICHLLALFRIDHPGQLPQFWRKSYLQKVK